MAWVSCGQAARLVHSTCSQACTETGCSLSLQAVRVLGWRVCTMVRSLQPCCAFALDMVLNFCRSYHSSCMPPTGSLRAGADKARPRLQGWGSQQ